MVFMRDYFHLTNLAQFSFSYEHPVALIYGRHTMQATNPFNAVLWYHLSPNCEASNWVVCHCHLSKPIRSYELGQ